MNIVLGVVIIQRVLHERTERTTFNDREPM